MASTGARRGIDLYLYRNTGSYSVPTWTRIDNCRDAELGLKRTRIDSSQRNFSNIATEVPGLIKIEPKWQMIYDQSDDDLVAIQDAFFGTTLAENQIEFAFSDGDLTGSNFRYLRAVCAVFDVSEPQPLDGLDMVNVEVGPTYNTHAPSVVTG